MCCARVDETHRGAKIELTQLDRLQLQLINLLLERLQCSILRLVR